MGFDNGVGLGELCCAVGKHSHANTLLRGEWGAQTRLSGRRERPLRVKSTRKVDNDSHNGDVKGNEMGWKGER